MAIDDASAPRLVVAEPIDQAGLVLTVSKPQMVIGHSDTADLVLEDRFVSRRHALVAVDRSGQVTIQDLNSTGGTFVNDERLTGPRVLQSGDLVRFADLVARFELGNPPRTPAATTDPATQVLATSTGTEVPVEESEEAAAPAALPEAVAAGAYTVTGTVRSPARPGTGGLTVELVDKNVGGDQVLASAQTHSDGTYAFSEVAISAAYLAEHRKTQPDLQVRVSSRDGFLAASAARYSAPMAMTLDVALPADAPGLPSEYETLAASLAAAYTGSLGELREDADSQDITYLANKTGWDARAVALAALAAQFSRITVSAPVTTADASQTQAWPVPTVSLRPEFYYALFRAGHPANADTLFRASPGAVRAIWQQAITQGVIPQTLAGEVPAALQSFQALSAASLLTAARDLLKGALGSDTQRHQQFASLAVQHSDDQEALWNAVEGTFGPDTEARLRLDTQLAALTLNNAPLISALHEAEWQAPLASTLDLARRGYYQAAKWAALLDGGPVPLGLPGATADEQRSSYADLLAAQLRLSFPTAVIADLVRTGAAPVRGGPDVQHAVYDFLYSHQGEFELGDQPVEHYLARAGLVGLIPRPVVDEVKRIQRVYQITPDDQAFTALLRNNLDSAFKITRYDQAGFVRTFGTEMGGNDAAAQIYARAHLVYSTVLNVAATYLTGQRAPRLGSGATGLIDPGQLPLTGGQPDGAGSGSAAVIAAGPTLEELFGSLDYCQCDDCRSILSPAAYLVDLLDFLDNPPGSPGNPLDVLLSRRPDLQYLPLTCDNTNVALPYIDIVNETLEYFVCNNLSLGALPTGMAGAAYPASSLSASGGTPPYSWSLQTGSSWPAGLTLAADGTITGIPTAPGTTEFTVAVTDSTATAPLTSTGQLSVTVLPALVVTTPPGLPGGQAGVAYPATTLTAAGGIPPYTWTHPPGSLPAGLTLSSGGTISGTPSASGTTEFTVAITDATAPTPLTGTGQLSITVSSPPSSALAVTTPDELPAGKVGSPYPAAALTAAGGIPPYTWSLQAGSLPAGLTLSSGGTISGTPTAKGATEFTIAVTDSASPAQTATQQMRISVASGLTIVSVGALPPGQVGAAYPDQALSTLLTVAGGTSPYGWYLQPGSSLPAGLTMSSGGTISGTPTAGGTTSFVVSVLDFSTFAILSATQLMSISVASGLSVGPLGYAGHSTDDSVSSAELLASPQFVNDQAYSTLQERSFPPPLPFHRPLEQVRRYFALFGVPLQDAAVALLPVSSMTAWTAILTEQLGLSPPEYMLLTDHWLRLSAVYGYPTSMTDQEAIAALSGVQDFCRRIGIAYDDLFSILGTRFINPATALLSRLEALNAPFATLMNLNANPAANGTAFIQALPPGLDQAAYDNGNVVTWVTSNYDQIMRLITVVDPDGGTDLCAAASLELRYSNPDRTEIEGVPAYALHAIDFFRLLRFIRLWQKLGLSIEVTDDIISALYPAADLPTGADFTDLANLDAGFKTMLVRLGFACRLLDMLGLDPGSALQQALACWAPIGVTGANSLYEQLFLASSTLQPDPAFAPGPFGDVLTDSTQKLLGHEPALRAALNLTGAELALIVTALGFDTTTLLTLENVSAVYRRGWLARALRLSVMELLDLIDLSGMDPFAPLDLTPPSAASAAPGGMTPNQRHGHGPPLPPLGRPLLEPPMIRFVRLVQALQAASLRPAQALYVIWNHDTSGTAGPTEQDVTSLAATLRADFAAVESQFALADDPAGASAQQLMTLVYGSDATGFFFGLINGTMATTVPYSSPEGMLPRAVLVAASGRLSYDDLRKQLSYAGVLDPAILTAVENTAGSDTALLAALGALSAANHQAVDPFFATYPELQRAYHDYAASDDSILAKRTVLLAEILRDLKPLRKQEQALAAVTAAAGTDPSFAPAILDDPTVLPAAIAPVQAAVSDLTAIETPGLAAQFYLSNDPAAPPDISLDSVSALSYAPCAAGAAQTVLVAGPITPGDVLTITINGVSVPYDIAAGDATPAILAAHTAQAIGAATAPDPLSGLPLNSVVTAAGPAGVITITPADPAITLTLACAASTAGTGTYTSAGQSPALQATVTGTFAVDDILTTTLNGATVAYAVQPGDTAAAIIASNIASTINQATQPEPATGLPLNQVVTASGPDGAITIKAATAAAAMTITCSQSLPAARSYTTGPPVPASQIATVSGAITAGNVLTTTVNGIAIPYTVLAADTTLAILASHIAAAVNATTTPEAATGQPLNTVIAASSTGDVITIAAAPPGDAFTLACALAPGAYTASGQVQTSATAVVSGAITPGDVLTTTVNGIAIPYPVQAADTTVTILASHIAAAINATSTPDPATGQPLSTVIAASYAGGIITVTAVGAGLAVSLGCASSAQATEGYATGPASAGWQAAVSGGFAVGDVLTTTVNGMDVPYPVADGDGTPVIIAGHIAAAVNADTRPDPATGRPLNSIITAVSVGGTVLVKAAGPSFTLLCALSSGATETCTVAGELPASPGGGVIAADWYGYIDVPQDGYYDIRVQTDRGAFVSLEIDGAAVTMAPSPGGSLWSNQGAISLSVGALTTIALTVTSLAATMAVSWESAGLGWQPIPGTYLYSGTVITRIQSAYSRFVKATALATALSLTASEIAYLGADPDLAVSGQPWLNVLPTAGSPDPASLTATIRGTITAGDVLTTTINGIAVPYPVTAADATLTVLAGDIASAVNATTTADPFTGLPLNDIVTASSAAGAVTFTAVSPGAAFTVACATSPGATETYAAGTAVPGTAAALTGVLSILLDYARVKAALSPGDERVLTVVQDPTTDALTALTGWDPNSVNALLQQLFGNTLITSIGHVENLRRLYDAYAIVKASGISADRLITAVTTNPAPAIADGLQAAVRSRYAEADWLAVAKPINDTMRDLQRDALVAFILQQLGDQGSASPTSEINTPDKLYEYLLMDVQMEPCMQTSRVRHALSAVQLFTEMCLRNLIPQVSPQDIPSGWEWRKRYRVWQANREVFLWPENWLDPELRDNQSPFFTQTLGELLQGDMTDAAATTAYLGYLTNLESVAKLEPSGIWYDGTDGHVIARTAGAQRKYYHRQMEGASWTPWAEIKLGIEDSPVVPYVWNGRLLLFWLRIVQAPVDGSLLAAPATAAATTSLVNLTYGEMFPTNDQAVGSTVVNVSAILCYSEYINGQWQPVKTSDPTRPTSLGTFAAGTFDRSQLELSVVPPWIWGWSAAGDSQIWVEIDTDQIVPDIGYIVPTPMPPWFPPIWSPLPPGQGSGFLSGFLLYNTHSLPVRHEDAMLPAPVDNSGERRLFGLTWPGSQSLEIDYDSPLWSGYIANIPISSLIGIRTVQSQLNAFPKWSSTAGAWFSPFFVEDSRHVFYVTTSGSPPADVNADFGAGATGIRLAGAAARRIPPLIIQTRPAAAGQKAAMSYLIGSRAPVTYKGRVIAASGSATGGHATARRQGD
jgi:pSer/pThr/pTyr-binding forkhead associated (FHA) protein